MAVRGVSFTLIVLLAFVASVCANTFNIPSSSTITFTGANWVFTGGVTSSGSDFSLAAPGANFNIASGATLTITGTTCNFSSANMDIQGSGNAVFSCASTSNLGVFNAANTGSLTINGASITALSASLNSGSTTITSSTIASSNAVNIGVLTSVTAVSITDSTISSTNNLISIGNQNPVITINMLSLTANANTGSSSIAWSTATITGLTVVNSFTYDLGTSASGACSITDSSIVSNLVAIDNSASLSSITTLTRVSITSRTNLIFGANAKTRFVDSFTLAYSAGASSWNAKLTVTTAFTRSASAAQFVTLSTNTINTNLFTTGIDGGNGNCLEVTTTGTNSFTINLPGVVSFGGSVGGTYSVTSTDGNAVYPCGSLSAGTLVAAVPLIIPSLKVFASKTVNLYGSNSYTITSLTLGGPSSVLDVSRQSTVTFDTITGDGTVNGVAEAVILTRVSPRPRITFNVRKVTLDSAIIDVRLNSGTADQVVLQSGAELSVVAPSSFSISGAGTNVAGSGSKVLIADRITGASLGGVPQSQTGLYLGLYGTSYYLINPVSATITSSLFQRQGQVFSLDENIDFLLNVQPPGTPGVPTASDFVIVNAKLKSIRQVADYTTSKRSIEAGAPSDQFVITVAAVCDGLVSVTWSGTVGGTPIAAPATFTASYAGCLARQFCL